MQPAVALDVGTAVRHHLGAGRLAVAVHDVLLHRLLHHGLKLAALPGGDFLHFGQHLGRGLAGKLYLLCAHQGPSDFVFSIVERWGELVKGFLDEG